MKTEAKADLVTVRRAAIPWSTVVFDKRFGPISGGHHQCLKQFACCPPIHPLPQPLPHHWVTRQTLPYDGWAGTCQ